MPDRERSPWLKERAPKSCLGAIRSIRARIPLSFGVISRLESYLFLNGLKMADCQVAVRGAGGFDFQAEGFALVSAKLLAKETLNDQGPVNAMVNITSNNGLHHDFWDANPNSQHRLPDGTNTEDQTHHFAGYLWLGARSGSS